MRFKNDHNQKHLTLSDRVYIEQELLQSSTLRSIAHILHKDPFTISKEIRLHEVFPKTTSFKTPVVNSAGITTHVRCPPSAKCPLVASFAGHAIIIVSLRNAKSTTLLNALTIVGNDIIRHPPLIW